MVQMDRKYTETIIRKYDLNVEAEQKAKTAAVTKIWWIPYHKRPDHPTPYHRNSPLPTPIPGPDDIHPQASAFMPTLSGEVTNERKRKRQPCECEVCRRPKSHRSVKTQTYESTLSPGWHAGEDTIRAPTGRGPKRNLRKTGRAIPDTETPTHTYRDPIPPHAVQPSAQPPDQTVAQPINTGSYTLNVGPSQIFYDFYTTQHTTRGKIIHTYGFPDFRAATREGMIHMIISTERTVRTIMASPRFQNIQSAFAINRAMHLQGAAVTVHCNRLLLMTIDQDRTIKYSYFYALGSKVSINDQILTVSEFWRFLEAKHPPPKTMIRVDANRQGHLLPQSTQMCWTLACYSHKTTSSSLKTSIWTISADLK